MTSAIDRRQFLKRSAGAAALASLAPSRLLGADEEPVVRLLIWENYLGENTVQAFIDATGIDVRLALFSDPDEMSRRVRTESGWDVIVSPANYVDRMLRAGALAPLDHARLPNIRHIDASFMNASFDPGRRHSIAYLWGTVGIGYRRSAVEGTPDSWRWLYADARYARRIGLMADAEVLLQMALKYLGHSLNTVEPDAIAEAERLIIKQKPRVKAFIADRGEDFLLAGEADLVLEWNGDILQAMERDDDLDYVIPREGSLLWQDCLCIPKPAPRPRNAHTLINFLLEPEIAADIAATTRYASPNAAARELLPASYRENEVIFPPADVLARCEISRYRGERVIALYERAWERIQAA